MDHSKNLQAFKKKNTMTVEDSDDKRTKVRVENVPKQRKRTRVDKRWEIEFLTRMKEKLLIKKKNETPVKIAV